MTKTRVNWLVLVGLSLLVAACGGGTGGQPPSAPQLSGQAALDAQATLAVWGAQETAVAESTHRSVQATADAVAAIARSTSDAAAAQATGTAVASQATGQAAQIATAAAEATATTSAMVATATWDALVAQEKEISVQQTAEAGAYSLSATATADAGIVAFMEAEAAQTIREREAAVARQQMWNRITPWLVAAIVVVGSALVMMMVGGYVVERANRAKPQPAGDTWVMWHPEGPRVIPAQRPTLPRVEEPRALLTAGTTPLAPENTEEAAWSDFARWRSSTRAPLGRAGDGPVLLDARVSPHLFIAGSSRRGKTSGGLVPYVAWALSAGFNVMLLGERAADFGAFYGHSNAANLRAFSDEDRVELTRDALEAARREMERRDHVLHGAGLNTWHELLRRQPDEVGPLLVVVDEFLALATMGGTAVHRSMMQNVASLTSQAGKFGIGLALAATDPRREALGPMGYLAIKQCARMAFGFNDRGSSRSVLGDEAAFNLPPGAFIFEDVGGGRRRGAAFRPTAGDVRALLAAGPSEARPLPEALRAVVERADGGAEAVDVWSEGTRFGDLDGDGDEDAIIMPAPRFAAEPDPDNLTTADKERIVEAYRRERNMAAVQREIFTSYNGTGGRAFYAIRQTLAEAGLLFS